MSQKGGQNSPNKLTNIGIYHWLTVSIVYTSLISIYNFDVTIVQHNVFSNLS